MKFQRGLSLLELLVAFAIMAFSLGILYQASGSNIKNTSKAVQYQRALMLAESTLTSKESVNEAGWNESGQLTDLRWQISSTPYLTDDGQSRLSEPLLHRIVVQVAWGEGASQRSIQLTTLRPQHKRSDAGPQR